MTTASNILLEARGVGIVEAAATLKQTQPTRLVILAGAGISIAPPAACPTFNGLLQEILASATSEYSGLIDLANAIAARDKEKPIKPELLFQVLHANMGAGILGCLDSLLQGQPNVNHRAIAQLGAQGATNTIITTNFDTYIEDALTEAGCKFQAYFNSAPKLSSRLHSASRTYPDVYVVKLHGSLQEASSIMITLRQAGRQLGSNIEAFLKHVLTDCTLLVIGYSGNDDDIFPLLKSSAESAHCVLWVLHKNEDTLRAEPNVEDFARTCAKCKLVLANGQDLLPLIVSEGLGSGETKMSLVSEIRERRMQRLTQWASRFSANAWTNCFCELLLLLETKGKEEVAGLILTRSFGISRQSDDPLISANALRNCGLALISRGDSENGIKSLSDAFQSFLMLGRPREIVEVAAMLVENTSTEILSDEDDGPLTSASWFVQDAYSQGLFNYAAGLEVFRKSKFVTAEKFLLIAGGYALEAGDTVTLRKSVAALEKLYANPAQYLCPTRLWQQLAILRDTLDNFGTPGSSGQTEILRLFQAAVRMNKWLFFKLEAAKCLGLTSLCWLVALAIWRSPVGAIKYALYGTAGYAISKILEIVKKRRYVDIDRA